MDAIKEVVKSPNASESVLLFAILAIILVAFCIPLYRLVSKAAEKKREQYLRREQILIDVVKGNTETTTELATFLKNMNDNCLSCKQEQNDKIGNLAIQHEEALRGIHRIETIIDERLDRRIVNMPVNEERRNSQKEI